MNKSIIFSFLFSFLIISNLFSEGFVAGTLVKTPNGHTSIDQLKEGDLVVSYELNNKESKTTQSVIKKIYKDTVTNLLEVKILNEKLCFTPNQKFLSDEKSWILLKQHEKLGKLFGLPGNVAIENINYVEDQNGIEIYTLTVDPPHNFFVTKYDILVHNFLFAVPLFTWVFGEGVKFISLAALALIVGHQVVTQGIKEAAEKAGADTSGYNPSLFPQIDPNDPKDPKNKKDDDKEKDVDKKSETKQKEEIDFTENSAHHTFKNQEGHLSQDTPENRKLLKNVANDEKNFLGPDKHGTKWYAKNTEDGKQIWTQVRNGKIINGGVNNQPKQFNPETGLSSQIKSR